MSESKSKSKSESKSTLKEKLAEICFDHEVTEHEVGELAVVLLANSYKPDLKMSRLLRALAEYTDVCEAEYWTARRAGKSVTN